MSGPGGRVFRFSRRWWLIAAGTGGAALAAGLRLRRPAPERLPAPCRRLSFEGADTYVCEIRPGEYAVALRLKDLAAKPFGSLKRAAAGSPVVLAMNAGMYHDDLSPVGLYVENGVEIAPLNRDEGEGNFFLKPNGVFFIESSGKASLLETEAFAAARPPVRFATQSGPMLVIAGQIHPRFQPDGTSRFIRNGVGVRGDGAIVLAISRTAVSLGAFARLFRDGLSCPDALFFDGAVSALYDGERYLVGGEHPAGPVLVVTARG